MIVRLFLAFSLSVSSVAALAADPAPEQPAKTDADRKICKSQAPTFGRLPPKKVCRTAAQWEDERAAHTQSLRNSEIRGGH